MKRILVIGEGSFVGNSFIDYLAVNYPDEYTIDNISSRDNKWKEISFKYYDVVYNVAGLAHVKAKKKLASKYYEINRDLPVLICKKVKEDGCRLFVHMSSMIVFGGMSKVGKDKIITKETEPNPENFYGDSKLNADRQLLAMVDDNFHVAIMRPPLLYSQNARDNFPRLIYISRKSPVFPTLKNEQSMLYVYNLAELIRLIIENFDNGIFYPQNREYSCTSDMVQKFAKAFNHKIYMLGFFNPLLHLMSHFFPIINKAFGNLCYDKSMSSYYNWEYCKYSLDESIEKTATSILEKKLK